MEKGKKNREVKETATTKKNTIKKRIKKRNEYNRLTEQQKVWSGWGVASTIHSLSCEMMQKPVLRWENSPFMGEKSGFINRSLDLLTGGFYYVKIRFQAKVDLLSGWIY